MRRAHVGKLQAWESPFGCLYEPERRRVSDLFVDLGALPQKLFRLLAQPDLDRLLFGNLERGRVVADVLRDLHRAEVGAAHRAEVGKLRAFGGEGLVVELAGGLRVKREVELVLPAELEA